MIFSDVTTLRYLELLDRLTLRDLREVQMVQVAELSDVIYVMLELLGGSDALPAILLQGSGPQVPLSAGVRAASQNQ